MTGLYLHVPFCARACPYCDFDFEVSRAPDVGPLLAGYERELRSRPNLAPGPLRTVYFGGGTPSVLGAEGLSPLCEWVASRFDLSALREWTVELNPEHVDDAVLDALHASGVTRASLGVQSMSALGLEQLGRVHSTTEARQALERARARFDEVGVDLIVGWPGQDRLGVESDVEAVVAAGATHVSVYALTVEPGTPWTSLIRRGRRAPVDDDHQAEMLTTAAHALTHAGFPHYELSNYGVRPGLHNTGYWTGATYVGLGPSAASGRRTPEGAVVRRQNPRGFATWSLSSRAAVTETLAPAEAVREALWLGLRRLAGVDLGELSARYGCIDAQWGVEALGPAVERGDVEIVQGVARMRGERWLFHDRVGLDLL